MTTSDSSELIDWQSRYTELQSDYEDFRQQSTDVESELESQNAALTLQIDALTNKLAVVTEKLSEEIKRYQSRLSSQSLKIQSLEQSLTQSQTECDKWRQQSRGHESQLEGLEKKLRILSAKQESMTEELDDKTELLIMARQEFEEVTATNATQQQSLRQQIKQLKQQLELTQENPLNHNYSSDIGHAGSNGTGDSTGAVSMSTSSLLVSVTDDANHEHPLSPHTHAHSSAAHSPKHRRTNSRHSQVSLSTPSTSHSAASLTVTTSPYVSHTSPRLAEFIQRTESLHLTDRHHQRQRSTSQTQLVVPLLNGNAVHHDSPSQCHSRSLSLSNTKPVSPHIVITDNSNERQPVSPRTPSRMQSAIRPLLFMSPRTPTSTNPLSPALSPSDRRPRSNSGGFVSNVVTKFEEIEMKEHSAGSGSRSPQSHSHSRAAQR